MLRPKPKVVLTHSFLPEIVERELAPHAQVVIARTRAELAKNIRNSEGLITRFSDRVDEKLLKAARGLRVVANFAVGVDNIDLEACRRRGIAVTNTPGVLTQATAELSLALLLAAARRIPEGERMCRAGKFKGWDPQMLLGQGLAGRTAVLVGQGRIGRATEKLYAGVGMKTQWITRADSPAQVAAKLSGAQVLSLHCSLNPSTHHWLNAERIECLPRDSIVINTTRGPVVDERALVAALKGGRIFAAGLDVYEREPAIPATLRKLSNVVLLPHLGSATLEARAGMARLAISGCLGVLAGRRPANLVS